MSADSSGDNAISKPKRGIFASGCAWAGKLSAKSNALSNNETVLIVIYFLRFLALDSLPYALGVLSPNHSIRPRQEVWRNHQTDLFRRFKIDEKFKLDWLLDWNLRRLCALENFIDISRGAPV